MIEKTKEEMNREWAERLRAESHWVAQQRLYLLVLVVVVVNIAGGGLSLLAVNMPGQIRVWPLPIFLLAALTTALVSAPFIAFLTLGWYVRYREFENSLKCEALSAYLQRFWSKWLIDALNGSQPVADVPSRQAGTAAPPESQAAPNAFSAPPQGAPADWRNQADRSFELCDRLFSHIYHQQYGLAAFVPPFCILVVMVYAASAIVGWVYMCASCGKPAATCIFGLSVPGILASFAGAFFFVASDSVLAVRRRALNVSDIYWYSLRLLLAIPFALVAGAIDEAGKGATVLTFVIATLPLGEIVKQVRRVAAKNFSTFEAKKDEPDQLLNLSGVTKSVSQTLQVEGIDSIEQVAAADPVTLSIRTGFPFRFTLRLGSQAIVRRHFGDGAAQLLPIGLGDVVPIYLLVQAMDGEGAPPVALPPGAVPQADEKNLIVTNAAARLFPNDNGDQREAVVKMKFRQIAAEEYTLMLVKITPLDPAL
ncbi:hypothetical protein [Paraburkholderia lycopersici]|uniref:Uncharacterized protein n=1 Tax=Paraburkholderia lycopersici TaxID=416944 RepID=A0A1G6MA01_9BURK|nr:hypothetical protein [Paraburkholderia lycopersici]SDC51806.1 hypothetical protein SAMN05421548_107161 [Paraburkholderia lycopersici]